MKALQTTMKLLIVDDNQPMRHLIKGLLADLTDSITECGDGIDAQASYIEHQPDWVLMDLMMPQVDGLTAARQILTAYPDARIVIITDHESPALREAAQSAGAVGYVLKDNLLNLRELLIAHDPGQA